MVVVVFRARVRPGVEEQLNRVGERKYELGSQMPGFVSYKDFVAEDCETLSIKEFESLENVVAWREHPEHKEAQAQGRFTFFAEYQIQVCEVVRTSSKTGNS
jgi:heme-degrading monooxygenase HmoA